jgi:hypothetical protein
MKLIGFATLLVLLACQDENQCSVEAKLGAPASRNARTTQENTDASGEALPRLNLVREENKKRNLIELEHFGGNPGDEFIPLGLCEGDCDDDDDVS